MFTEYALAILFYSVFSVFIFIGLPFTGRFIPSRSLAYVAAKPLGLIIFGYGIWLLASLHILDYQEKWLIVTLFAIAACTGAWFSRGFFKDKEEQTTKHKKQKAMPFYKKILLVEAAVVLLYLAYLFVRSYNAGINGTERFMDMMLLTAAGHTHYFPFADSWYAGKTINYYYYGSYLMSLISNIAHLPYALTYTYSLGLVYVESALLSAALIFSMARSKMMSLVGAFFVTSAGTLFFTVSTIAAALQGQGYSYASSTRLYTPSYMINEIPSYSFTVGDLHAHVLALPFFILGLILLYACIKAEKPNKWFLSLLALSFATSGMINMWDLVTLSSLFIVLALLKTWHTRAVSKNGIFAARFYWIITALATLCGGLILMLPNLLHFQNPTLGIGFDPSYVIKHNLHDIQYPTPLLAEIGMWGVFLLGIAWTLARVRGRSDSVLYSRTEPAGSRSGREGAPRSAEYKTESLLPRATLIFLITLCIVSLGIIIGVELFFIRDLYSVANPPYFRANTTFKFGYHAWTMLSIAFAISMAWLMCEKRGITRFLAITLTTVGVVAGLFYPYEAFVQFYLPNTDPHDLDGSVWMKRHSIEDWQTIQFINNTFTDRAVIAEAVGDSYSWYGRISAFTGMITPMGWKSHEWTWRFQGKAAAAAPQGVTVETGWGPVSVVAQDIQNLYETTDAHIATGIIKKYGIQYVYVGDMERTMYPKLQEQKFSQIGTVIFQLNKSRLYTLR